MPSPTRVSGKEAVRAFVSAGFVHTKTNGSHYILKKDGWRYHLSVPVHGNETLGIGLLKSLIKASGLSVDQFNECV